MRRQTIAASIEALSVVATALGIFTSIPKQVGRSLRTPASWTTAIRYPVEG